MSVETTKCVSEQFFPKDWLSDSALRSADLATRGAWMECLCHMWLNRVGHLTGTTESFAAMWRCSLDEAVRIIEVMQTTRICDVNNRNGNVTLTSRRLSRRCKEREQAALRMRRMRERGACYADRDASVRECSPPIPIPTDTINNQEPSLRTIRTGPKNGGSGCLDVKGFGCAPLGSTADGDDPDGDSRNSEWSQVIWAAILDSAPPELRQVIRRRLRTLRGYPPARVLATLLDVARAPASPKSLDEAMSWFLGRLKRSKLPLDNPKRYCVPDDLYDEAKRLLKRAMTRA